MPGDDSQATDMRTGIGLVGRQTPMRLRTVGIIAILSFGLLGGSLLARAAPAGKVYRVGYLSRSGNIPEAFKQALRELGYVEGENIVYLLGEPTSIKARAAELVQLKVDVITTRGTPVARAAKQATSTIPIVMHAGANPVQSGLVASLARPGGNITGLTAGIGRGLYEKHLELLKVVVPKLSRVAALWNPPPELRPIQKSFEHSAGLLGLKVQSLEVRSPDDLASAFQAAIEQGA